MLTINHPGSNRPRGAIAAPRHRLAAAAPYRAYGAAPPSWIWLPRTLSMWYNATYGVCVTSEEAFNKACSGVFIDPEVMLSWAVAHDARDGAYLDQVLDQMAVKGFSQDGNVYNDGPKAAVDYTDYALTCNAIAKGPVKIGVAADQLENVVRSANGWFGLNFGSDHNLDHCISLCGYGPIGQLAAWLGVSLPANAMATAPGYAAFTWGTVGILSVPSMVNITGEAWSRSPNTVTVGGNRVTPDVVFTPDAPPPPPPPPPVNPPSITLSRAVRAGESVWFNNAKPAGKYVLQAGEEHTAEAD